MALICTNCNAENPRTNRFCDTCGAKLPKEEAQAAPAKKTEAPKAAPARKASKGEPEPEYAPTASVEVGGLAINKYLLWMIGITLLGAFYRLWDLGAKPLHHDESIHAWYAFKLFKGEPYLYDPAYHGPFRYHFNALFFYIFGASDFSTRLLPVSFGVFVIAWLWQWRQWLGERGAVITAGLIAISPTWTYVSRFIRDDIPMAVGSMAMIWGLFKWFDTRNDKYIFWGVAGWMVAFTSHEGTWIFMGIFGTYLFTRWLWEKLANTVEEEMQVSDFLHAFRLPLRAPIADFSAGLASLLLLLTSNSAGFNALKVSPVKWLLMLLTFYFVLAVLIRAVAFSEAEVRRRWITVLCIFFIPFTLLYSTFFTNMDGWFKGAFDSIAYWLGEQKTGRADQPWQFYIYLLALYEAGIVAFAMLGGLRLFFGSGKPQYFWMKIVAWVPVIAAIFVLINYPKSPVALPVMALMASLGAGMAAFSSFAPEKGNHFKVFLIYWSILAYAMFTIAGERMPWLTLHPLTPLTLLAGVYLGEFFDREKPHLSEHWIAWGLAFIPLAFLASFIPRQFFQVLKHAPIEFWSWIQAFGHGGRHGAFQSSGWANNIWMSQIWKGGPYWWILPCILAAVLVALTPFVLERYPRLKYMTRGIFMGLFIFALLGLSHGTHNLLFDGDGADPREQHVYVQSSVELVELSAKLERMSRAVTGGPYLKVAVEDLCSWPLSWYLRDLKNAQIGFGPPLTQDKVRDFPVVITGYENINQADHDKVIADSFSNSFNAYPLRFRRWWGPSRDALMVKDPRGGYQWGQIFGKLWDLYMYREPWLPNPPVKNPQFQNFIYDKGDSINSPYGSFDAVVWVRKDVERFFQ